jgi:hypothetical protein
MNVSAHTFPKEYRGVYYSISFIFWWATFVTDNFLLTVKSQEITKKYGSVLI